MNIFVVGSLNMDLTMKAPRIPKRGETVAGGGFMTTAGGKGGNQAVAASKLGGKVYMAGCVGDAFGNELVSSLENAGVDTRFVVREKGVSSGIAVILVTEGDNRILLDKGANGRVTREIVDRALARAEAGDFLVVQLEIEISVVEYALKRAKELGMTTVLNPAPASGISGEAFAYCDYITPNQTEAEFYTGIYPDGEEGARACAEIFLRKGVKNVLVTLGLQGSAALIGGKWVSVPALKVNAVDTTAAGDTYVGAFVVKLSEGAEAEEAMRFASAASAVTVTRRGAQEAIPVRAEAETLLR